MTFLILGITFIAIGASGQTVFLVLGLVFVAIGIGSRGRKRGRSDPS